MDRVRPSKKGHHIFVFFALVYLGCFGSGIAQRKRIMKRVSIACELGNFQPHSLNDEPRFDTFGAAGATPYVGLAVSAPFFGGMGLRASAGYWSLRELDKTETVHSLTLHPITLDIKYWFVPDYRLSAYVMYGGSVVLGIENETKPFGRKLHKARTGFGASLGAGFDFELNERAGLGMAFQYLYIRFREPVGGVDDFSGPKITVMAFFLL